MTVAVPLLGLETEYGIIREDLDDSDPVEESMALLKQCAMKSVFQAWTYSRERTHLDMRGFTVTHLAQDEEEDEFCAEDRKRPYSYWDMKCDRVLVNGARFYNDHTHPEYSTPECRGVFELVTHDQAGDRILLDCVRRRNQELGGPHVQVFKNNTDYSGHSYGTHDNYTIPRRLDFDVWVRGLVPFLVTRQLYAGAGKVGTDGSKVEPFSGLQLGQRSDFVECVLSIETMTQRPIINTRDEPHASTDVYRRLHLILGDANMSPYATALKLGTTRLVLALIADEKLALPWELEDPVRDVQRTSRDLTGTVLLKRAHGAGTITPLAIQAWYLEQAKKHPGHLADADEEKWIVQEWERTLNDLKEDPHKLSDRIDWAIKENLFTQFMEAEGVTWDDPVMQSLDLEYHNLDPERGLYYGLLESGDLKAFTPEAEVDRAVHNAPPTTRARIRGQMVDQEQDNIRGIHWTGIEFKNGEYLDLTDIIHEQDVEQVLETNKELFAWK